MHGTVILFDGTVFAESTLVTGTWQTGVTALTRARAFVRLFSGVARRCRESHILWIDIFRGRESDAVTTRSLTLVNSTIFTIILFGRLSIIVALEEILEILKVIQVKVTWPWYT